MIKGDLFKVKQNDKSVKNIEYQLIKNNTQTKLKNANHSNHHKIVYRNKVEPSYTPL